MKHVRNKWNLRTEKSKYVLVETEDQVYMRVDDEYIPKQYFSTREAREILKVTRDQMYDLIRKHGIKAPADKGRHARITVQQLRQML